MNGTSFVITENREIKDARERATEAAIQGCFLRLLQKRPIEKISVSELCQLCGINRSTFYRHYEDMYALLERITADAHSALFHDVIKDVDISEDFEKTGYDYILNVCRRTREHLQLYKLLLYGRTTSLRERMTESVYQLYINAHEQPSNFRSHRSAFLHYRFLVNGMIGVWAAWVKEDCKTSDKEIAAAIREEISSFYTTMWRLYGR